jgi:hypothetical protein
MLRHRRHHASCAKARSCCQHVVSLSFDAYRFGTTQRAEVTHRLGDGGSRTLPLDFIHKDADKVPSSPIVEFVETSVLPPHKKILKISEEPGCSPS